MATFPDAGRRTGHLLLDILTAYEPGGDPDNVRRMQLALDAIQQLDTVRLVEHDDGTHELDASDLVMPAVVLLNWMLENGTGDRTSTIATMREYLDS